MGDLFHNDVPFEFIDRVIDVIEQTPQHTYQILTKRVGQMIDYHDCFANVDRRFPRRFPKNMWLGVSACNQREVDSNVMSLLWSSLGRAKMRSGFLRFVSIEPMLEPIDITRCISSTINYLDWVIVGGETGANARPMDADWARWVRDQCRSAGVPFFFKRMSGKQPVPDDLMVREFPVR
jgi:protein gp37